MIVFFQDTFMFLESQNKSSNIKLIVCIAHLNDSPDEFKVFILLILEATSAELIQLRNTSSDLSC